MCIRDSNIEYQVERYQQYLQQNMGSEADEVMKSGYPIQNYNSRLYNSPSPAEERNFSDTNNVMKCYISLNYKVPKQPSSNSH